MHEFEVRIQVRISDEDLAEGEWEGTIEDAMFATESEVVRNLHALEQMQ